MGKTGSEMAKNRSEIAKNGLKHVRNWQNWVGKGLK